MRSHSQRCRSSRSTFTAGRQPAASDSAFATIMASGHVVEAPPSCSFPRSAAARIAAAFGRPADAFRQVLIDEYRPGAGIGWHRDKPQFDEVVGVSLLSPCLLRFRRRLDPGFERMSLNVEPRSAYLLSGSARTAWEHSIPPLDTHRYSITFRTL